MTVAQLISKLQQMPQDADVQMILKPGNNWGNIVWVEKRYTDLVFLNDEYWTPYYEEGEENGTA